MTSSPFYIGTTKEYRPGDFVEEASFFADLELARKSAHSRALEEGELFGMVYEVSHYVDEDAAHPARVPHRILRLVDWSI